MPEEKKSYAADYERREAERQAAEDELRLQLAEIGFDGPFKIEHGRSDPFAGLFGGNPDIQYAICVGSGTEGWRGCGAMIRLNDPMERDGGLPAVERGIYLHSAFHRDPRG